MFTRPATVSPGCRLTEDALLPSAWLSSIAGGSVFLKIESINLTNSSKSAAR